MSRSSLASESSLIFLEEFNVVIGVSNISRDDIRNRNMIFSIKKSCVDICTRARVRSIEILIYFVLIYSSTKYSCTSVYYERLNWTYRLLTDQILYFCYFSFQLQIHPLDAWFCAVYDIDIVCKRQYSD